MSTSFLRRAGYMNLSRATPRRGTTGSTPQKHSFTLTWWRTSGLSFDCLSNGLTTEKQVNFSQLQRRQAGQCYRLDSNFSFSLVIACFLHNKAKACLSLHHAGPFVLLGQNGWCFLRARRFCYLFYSSAMQLNLYQLRRNSRWRRKWHGRSWHM